MTNGLTGAHGAGAHSITHVPPTIIDAHCHVFNASDLPTISFIRIVVRERYNASGNALDLLVGLITSVLTGNAPRAADELADIEGRQRPPRDGQYAFDASGNPLAPPASAPGTPVVMAGNDVEEPTGDGPAPRVSAAATAARTSRTELGRLIRWARLFNKSRRGLVKMLASIYQQSGHRCVLMAPALVDYNAWLQEPEKKYQRLTDQVRVMGAIARQPGVTRVHGFVGFDPVRAILADAGWVPAGAASLEPFNPHELVHEAVTQHGFLGVKLYPPMGFRAWNNDSADMTFPEAVKRNVNSDGISDRALGRLIDAELAKLYRYCAEHGVPILAHGTNSNPAGSCYGWRASPQYWDQVIEKFSTPENPLRVCLAHLCSFNAHKNHTACLPAGTIPEAWENIFGGIIQKPKGEYAFADLSYFQELLDRKAGWEQRRSALVAEFRTFLRSHATNAEHLCYGSDWLMLGAEERHQHHHEEVAAFLHDAGCSRSEIGLMFFGNARKLLGLRQGDKNRERLERFYRDNQIWDQFPQLDAMV
jgi:hypothetical protein